MARAALLSLSNREGCIEFAQGLIREGFTLLATSGTGKALEQASVPFLSIDAYTGQPEILDGRVKTLHPKIHAGILAKHTDPHHQAELSRAGILPIEVVAVNLYPFVASLGSGRTYQEMVELIDVGGPTMLRAAAKNAAHVLAVIDPNDYPAVIDALRQESEAQRAALRQRLAVKVFTVLAHDTLAIAQYLSEGGSHEGRSHKVGEGVQGFIGYSTAPLRYGENPHQTAGFYEAPGAQSLPWAQLQGKELSYNNLLDLDAVVRILARCPKERSWAVIVKHGNPCGVASGTSAVEALRRAKECDPRSHFGGIVGINELVSEDVAREVREDFAEVLVAPEISDEAYEVLASSKNLRVLRYPQFSVPQLELRSIIAGTLVQTADTGPSDLASAECMTSRKPSTQEMLSAALAWRLMGCVRSNAIVLVNNERTIGVGAGQMSRIDSVELAIAKAKRFQHQIRGATAASDAFFPFPDSITTLAEEGVSVIVAPRGAKRDDEVIQEAERCGVSLLFTADRHFRH